MNGWILSILIVFRNSQSQIPTDTRLKRGQTGGDIQILQNLRFRTWIACPGTDPYVALLTYIARYTHGTRSIKTATMSQPQELLPYNPAHEITVPVQAPEQYQQFPPPTSQPPVSEIAPTPSQTPAPHSAAPISPQSNVSPPHTYGSPDQYGSYAPPPQPPQQTPQEYYQQPTQGQYDAEKGGVPANIPPPGDGTSAAAYAPPVEGTAGSGVAPPAMITLFGKKFAKQTVIITAIVIAVVLIFIIGLGAGLGAKANKNKKKNSYNFGGNSGGGSTSGSSGCSGCDCFTDPTAYSACVDMVNKGENDASDLIKRLYLI